MVAPCAMGAPRPRTPTPRANSNTTAAQTVTTNNCLRRIYTAIEQWTHEWTSLGGAGGVELKPYKSIVSPHASNLSLSLRLGCGLTSFGTPEDQSVVRGMARQEAARQQCQADDAARVPRERGKGCGLRLGQPPHPDRLI